MKTIIFRLFVFFAVCLIIILNLTSWGRAESAILRVTDLFTGVIHPAGFQVDIIATGIPDVGDLTVDPHGDLIASQLSGCSPHSGNLFRITRSGVVTTSAVVPRGQGVHPDTFSGDLFFSNECSGEILRISPIGNVRFADVSGATEGVAVRTDGTVYVSRRDAIFKITRDGWDNAASVVKVVNFPGVPGLGGKFDAIAFEILPDGATGDLFAINEGPGGRIVRVNPDTGSTSLFSEYSGSGEALAVAPHTAAQATGPRHLFVSYASVVTRISPDGSSVETFAEIPGETLGVTVDDHGVVYVANTSRGLIYRLTPPPDEIPVSSDIHPSSCPNALNANSPEMLPVAIMGTPSLDVSLIDPASIKLEGVAPVRWVLEDAGTGYLPFLGKTAFGDCTALGPDGAVDLTLKFRTQDIVSAISPVLDREVRTLRLTGSLKSQASSTPIKGEDVVIVLKQ